MRNILILGSTTPTYALLVAAQAAALNALPVASGGQWRVIVPDGYGTDAEVARICQIWEIPLLVGGAGVRPANDTPLRFYERVICTTRNPVERRKAVLAYLRGIAHEIVELTGETDLKRRQERLRVPAHVHQGMVTRYDREANAFYLSNLPR